MASELAEARGERAGHALVLVLVAALAALVPTRPVRAEGRDGSLVIGVAHRNDAIATRFGAQSLRVAWAGTIGAFHRIANTPVAWDGRLELFGVETDDRRGSPADVLAFVGLDLGLVFTPGGSPRGLLSGLRLGGALTLATTLPGFPGRASRVVRPRLSIGWLATAGFGPRSFPYRPIRTEIDLAWEPGTVLIELCFGIEASPVRAARHLTGR